MSGGESVMDRLNAALEGRYRVERELGEGGMATVFLAEDLKHDRHVAIKVLKPELAAVIGGDRFVSEIKTTASLQHPHILPLFDSGAADGFLYYVMPYVEGENLRQQLDREKQLGVGEAVRIAEAVASALHYAHEQGIVHRDIKPANILIQAGEPVVADFGIALAISAAGGGRLTETGMSVGTPHYMSPEQASADRDVSARSDIYALACVLYEMLAGEPPHTGSTAQAVLMRILTEEPRDISDVRKAVPPNVGDALTKALEKLPADRFETAEAFKRALTDEGFRYTPRPRTARRGRAERAPAEDGWLRDRRTQGVLAASFLLLLAAGWAGFRPEAPPPFPAPSYRFFIGDSLAFPTAVEVDISPYGDVVYPGLDEPGGARALRLRRPGDPVSRVIPNSSGALFPSFSPDGEWVAFVKEGGVKKVRITTGTEITLVPTGALPSIISVEWADDGTVITSGQEGIHRVPDVGGELEELWTGPAVLARLLPGGERIVFTAVEGGPTAARVTLLDLESRDTVTVAAPAGNAVWSPTGHLLYGHPSATIFALPFDLGAGEATGPPVPVQENVFSFGAVGFFALSESGAFVYRGGSGAPIDLARYELAWVTMDGTEDVLPLEPTDHPDVRVSPDGTQLAYTRDNHIHVFDLLRGTNQRLTFEGTDHHDPVWSPDGTRLAFASIREGGRGGQDIYVKAVDGRSPAEWMAGMEGDQYPADWLPDGTITLFHRQSSGAQTDIYMVTEGEDEPVPLLRADWNETAPRVSPDGSLMAYISHETGEPHLFVREFPDMLGRWQVSADPAVGPLVWTRDGTGILYRSSGSGRLIRAELERAPIRVSRRTEIGERPLGDPRDLQPGGDAVLVTRPLGAGSVDEAQQDMVVVTNWLDELRRRLGQRR